MTRAVPFLHPEYNINTADSAFYSDKSWYRLVSRGVQYSQQFQIIK